MKLTKVDKGSSKDIGQCETDDSLVAESVTVNAHMSGSELGLKITARINGRNMTIQMGMKDSLDLWSLVDGFKETIFSMAKKTNPEIGKLIDTLNQAKKVSGLSQDGLKDLVKDIVGKKPDHVEDFHGTGAQLKTYIEGIKEKHPGVEVRVGKVGEDGRVEMADSDEIEKKCDTCPSKEICDVFNEKTTELGEHVGEAGFILDKDYNPKMNN